MGLGVVVVDQKLTVDVDVGFALARCPALLDRAVHTGLVLVHWFWGCDSSDGKEKAGKEGHVVDAHFCWLVMGWDRGVVGGRL